MTDPLWAGRLQGGLHPAILDFTASLAVDRRLLPYDLRASAVHVRMLSRQGLIEEELAERICEALERVEVEPDAADEDVHSAIERLLGDLGPRVHAGRSRNDQVQTAMRLWAKDACDEAVAGIRGLAGALLDRAEADGGLVLPGYTHGQRAQPVWLGHHLAAHAWASGARRAAVPGSSRGIGRVPAGRRRAGGLEPAARPGVGCVGAGIRTDVRQLTGCRCRP